MNPSKHIFIQVDTDKVATTNYDKGELTQSDVLRSSLIFQQGSMAMGDPIKNFHITIEEGEDMYFTILPYYLFSRNKLYFTGFSNKEDVHVSIKPELSNDTPQLSFLLETGKLDANQTIHFTLYVQLDYINEEGRLEKIYFTIDPVLQIKQR